MTRSIFSRLLAILIFSLGGNLKLGKNAADVLGMFERFIELKEERRGLAQANARCKLFANVPLRMLESFDRLFAFLVGSKDAHHHASMAEVLAYVDLRDAGESESRVTNLTLNDVTQLDAQERFDLTLSPAAHDLALNLRRPLTAGDFFDVIGLDGVTFFKVVEAI